MCMEVNKVKARVSNQETHFYLFEQKISLGHTQNKLVFQLESEFMSIFLYRKC